MSALLRMLYSKPILVIAFFSILFKANAQSETFPSGSFIINMGATNPNTIANGLKPYGLIYDLIKNNDVPVKWVIGAGKIKDGVDFTHNGVQYRGGTFIISALYRSAAVNAKISSWMGQGVVGVTTTSPLTVNVTQTLKEIPRWTLDAANGAIAKGYLDNAGITLTAFPGAYNWKSPQTLDCCDDFFVMPHADPTWATHSNLFFWNQNCLGSIWAACHAVSAMENSINPANAAQQMNFLSTRTAATTPTPWPNNSLTLWGSHSAGSPPYTHRLFDDPVAQYLGTTDAAQTNGSEQIYLPKQDAAPNNTRWRPGVKVIAYDPTQINVTTPDLVNGNVAALMVYGRAFDNPARGFVMYEAGHSHDKGTAADVAAQRAFFNFSFFQVQPKSPNITVTGVTSGQNFNSGSVTNVSVSATSPLAGVTFNYLWTSSCGGTFANPTSATTTFTAPTVAGPTPCILTCKVSDNCGRTSFQSFPVVILAGPQPPVPAPDIASVSITCGTGTPVTVNVLANDSDPGALPLTLTNVTGAVNGTVSFTAAGNITFTPNTNFTGPLVLTYTVCNNATPVPLCANSTLTITQTGASAPSVANDAYTIAEDAMGTFNVLSNDAGGLTVIGITSGPANGKVSVNIDNTITYVPNADFAGTDNFTYRVTNGTGGYNTATVTVTVTNDACNGGTFQSGTTTINVTLTATEDAEIWNKTSGDEVKNYGSCNVIYMNGGATPPKQRDLIRYDVSSIPATATITSATVRLTKIGGNNTARNVSIHRVTNTWTEGTGDCGGAAGVANWQQGTAGTPWTTAGGDFDATATATVSVAGNGAYDFTATSLVQGWVNSSFANHGILGKFTTENQNSEINFASTENSTVANRPQLIVAYTTPICSAIPTRAPIAMPDTASTPNSVPVNIATATNDFFPVGGAVTYAIITAPVSGTATINGSGVVTYTPETSFNGVRSLTYRVNHTASGLSDTAAVYINIANGPIDAVDDNPLPGANSGLVQTINVKANDTDPEGMVPTATVSIATAPLNGTATVDGSNNIVYTPNAGFTGKDTLFYSLCEPAPPCGSPLCDTARVIITVLNRVPTANPDSKTILPCYSNTIDLIGNDTDPENGTLTVTNLSALSPGGSGTLVNNNDGTVTLTPATGFTGVITFTYTVTDDGITPQTSAPATVTITVANPVNTAPVAVNDVESINMNEILYASVLSNDYDPENNPLTNPVITVAPLHGTAVVNPFNGQIEYTPNTGYAGPDELTYRICDIPIIIVATCSSGPDLCATATLTISVIPIPESDNHSSVIPQPSVGQFITLNGGSNPPVLSGSDPVDCPAGCTLGSRSVIFDVVPGNSELYYNGVLVKAGDQIDNFNPALLQIKFTAASVGSTSTSFQYSFVNSFGKKDPSPATYQLTWSYPLPVKLTQFSGTGNKCDAILQWKTAQEINTDKFIIEQSSNGSGFTEIGDVKAANSAIGKSYQTTIAQATGIMYYRLKMLDKDGSFTYSPIVSVRTSCDGTDYMTVYPNPFNTTLTVSFSTSYKGQASLLIVNAVGQQLLQQKIQIVSPVNTVNLDMSNYNSGIYMLYLVDEDGIKIGGVQKLIKE